MNQLRTILMASLLIVPGGPLASQPPDPAQPQTFQGEIEVREIGVVVESPEGKSLGSVRPDEILVFDEGAPRQVIKTEPLRPGSGPSPWTLVLYFDRVLARPATTHDAALALSRRSRELTELGPVEIVTADPAPQVELAATRDARSLSAILGGIAARVQKQANQAARGEKPPAAPDPATLRRQLDRLLAFAGGRPDTGARALFLVADGFVPPPGEADLLTAQDPGAPVPPGTLAAALRESGSVLAAYGWVTFAGPIRDTTAERERRQMADMERIRVMAGGSKHTSGAPPVIPMRPDRGARGDERIADVFSRPDSAPWMALSQPTAGTVLGIDAQLASVIDGLSRRWRVWYRAPGIPDGKLRLVEVRLPSAPQPLRGPLWVRSSTPEGLAAARARLLADGSPPPGGGSGDLKLDAALDGRTLKLRVPPSGAATPGPVRVTVVSGSSSEVQHFVLPEVSLEKGWEHTLEIQPRDGARRTAVVVEDLARGRWGGAATEPL